jgi:hypothetical protein
MKFSQEQVDDTIIPKMELGNSANLIECFSYVHGHKEAQEVVIDLNGMKSIGSDPFYIEYNKTQDYSKNDSYLIKGNVTRKDWIMLNLNMDFMKMEDS